jgi:hypothetical protein
VNDLRALTGEVHELGRLKASVVAFGEHTHPLQGVGARRGALKGRAAAEGATHTRHVSPGLGVHERGPPLAVADIAAAGEHGVAGQEANRGRPAATGSCGVFGEAGEGAEVCHPADTLDGLGDDPPAGSHGGPIGRLVVVRQHAKTDAARPLKDVRRAVESHNEAIGLGVVDHSVAADVVIPQERRAALPPLIEPADTQARIACPVHHQREAVLHKVCGQELHIWTVQASCARRQKLSR